MRLLALPQEVSQLVVDGQLSMGQVRPLIGHPECAAMARRVVEKGLSARQVEALVKSQKSPISADQAAAKKPKATKTADIRALEDSMQAKLGLRLDIEWHEDKNRGRLVMHFNVGPDRRHRSALQGMAANANPEQCLGALCLMIRSARFHGKLCVLQPVHSIEDRIRRPEPGLGGYAVLKPEMERWAK